MSLLSSWAKGAPAGAAQTTRSGMPALTSGRPGIERLPPPLFTCEAVLAEAAHLLRREKEGPEPLLELIERGALDVAFSLEQNQYNGETHVELTIADFRSQIAD